MNNKITVEVKHLYKEIDDKVILKDINLQLREGLIYGIVGKNGSGKSMLFKAICGLINPTKGEIIVFDNKIHKGELPKNTGVIIESPGFLPQYSAYTNLKMLASINNIISNEEIKNTISKVGLDPEDKRPVKKYSLGMKQRLGIAQAIMEKPKLLILDEPMNALDQEGVVQVRSLLLELKKQRVTILLASHNKEDIETLCDCVYILGDGSQIDIGIK